MRSLFLISSLLFSSSVLAQTFADVAGSSDHPLFPKRIPGFYISYYEQKENDYASFPVATKPDAFIENIVKGKKTVIEYALKPGAKMPSKLLVRKIYTNAAKAQGAKIVFDGDGKHKRSEDDGGLYLTDQAAMVYSKEEKDIWSSIAFNSEHPEAEMAYFITIIEPLEKSKATNASSALLDELNANGKIELYIKFDRGKDFINPESQTFVTDVVNLLKNYPELNLSIEGHTDNIGDAVGNKILSEKRAKSVLSELVNNGIKADRLSSKGFGSSNPIATNATEEGKALNRRVELVKK